MAFGHASKPTRKYAYGVRLTPHGAPLSSPPFEGHDAALDQMRRAYELQMRLVGLEQVRRNRANAVVDSRPEIAPLLLEAHYQQSELRALRAELSASNSANREILSDPDLVARIEARRVVCESAWAALSSARNTAFREPAVRALLDPIDADIQSHKDAARSAATAAGLYWPTSLQVVQRVKRTGPPPHFQEYEGEEIISIQFQRKPDKSTPKVPVLDTKGNPRISPRSGLPMTAHAGGASLSTYSVFTPNSLCWIERTDHPKRVVVHFRVASDASGSPIWARLPTIMHRPLPDGEIKWAHLSRRRIGTHYKWCVMFDVARPAWAEHPAGAERARTGAVAVALGWRQIDGAVRAGEWVGSDGVTGTLRIPDDFVSQWRSLEALQSARDTEFERWRAGVLSFLHGRELPLEWQYRSHGLVHWRSPDRLAALVLWWRDNRLPGDADAFRAAEGELITPPDARPYYSGGRKQDRHLCDMQANRRARLIAWRKDLYHRFAIDLSCRYKSVVVAEINWHEIAENPEVERADERVPKLNRGVSACASLRDCFTKYLDSATVSAVHIADTCSACARRVRHPGRGRWIRCERCGGERVDRAENAARNLLSRALAPAAAI